MEAAPQNGIMVLQEGNTVHVFFDFEKVEPETTADGEVLVGDNVWQSTHIVVRGSHSYAGFVSAIVGERYPQADMDAVRLNYELAKDTDSGITEEKRTEYLAEYGEMQEWRSHAKEIAKLVLEELKS